MWIYERIEYRLARNLLVAGYPDRALAIFETWDLPDDPPIGKMMTKRQRFVEDCVNQIQDCQVGLGRWSQGDGTAEACFGRAARQESGAKALQLFAKAHLEALRAQLPLPEAHEPLRQRLRAIEPNRLNRLLTEEPFYRRRESP